MSTTQFNPPIWGAGLGSKFTHLFKSVSEAYATGYTSCGLHIWLPVAIDLDFSTVPPCRTCVAVWLGLKRTGEEYEVPDRIMET